MNFFQKLYFLIVLRVLNFQFFNVQVRGNQFAKGNVLAAGYGKMLVVKKVFLKGISTLTVTPVIHFKRKWYADFRRKTLKKALALGFEPKPTPMEKRKR